MGSPGQIDPAKSPSECKGVPKSPSGPRRVQDGVESSPTTTVGRAISVFETTSTADLPGKRFNAVKTPSGTPKAEAKKVARIETFSEVKTITYTPESKLNNNTKAL